MRIPLASIRPSPRPVRTSWDEAKLNELADSIQQQGLIVPVKVRPVNRAAELTADYQPRDLDDEINAAMAIEEGHGSPEWELVYGHRRTEAARRAGLQEVEAIVEGVDDDDAQWQALIENIVRADLTALEIAAGIKERRERGATLEEIGRRLGMVEGHVRHYLAMLNAPVVVEKVLQSFPTITQKEFANSGAAGLDRQPELRAAVLEKASKENLTYDRILRVAESVAAAPSEQAKRFLLEQQYSPTTHDPELIRSRAEQYGVSDPLYSEPKAQQASVAVSVAAHAFIEATKRWDVLLTETRKMIATGSVSPEGKQFIAHRVRQTIKSLETFLEELEG